MTVYIYITIYHVCTHISYIYLCNFKVVPMAWSLIPFHRPLVLGSHSRPAPPRKAFPAALGVDEGMERSLTSGLTMDQPKCRRCLKIVSLNSIEFHGSSALPRMIGLSKYISRRFKEHHSLQMCINSTDDDFNFRSKPTTLEPGSPSEKTGIWVRDMALGGSTIPWWANFSASGCVCQSVCSLRLPDSTNLS